jgi:hypothetical protein
MAPRAISELVVFVIILFLVPAVGAVLQNVTEPASTPEPSLQTSLYTIKLFIPSPKQIHSDQIKDLVNGPGGDVIIATAFGLSTFNGTWSTRFTNRDNISQGLMDDYITAVEFDHLGNLWLGYSGGLQIYNGVDYTSIRDQQLLKETRIHDLQRWNNDIWIATGHAGVHRYRDGTWTWFQPMTKNGPGFYEINSMALDSAGNMLVIGTENEGLWGVKSPDDPVRFDLLAGKDDAYGRMNHVRRDPAGGVYFFNASGVVHYDSSSGFHPVLTTDDLTREQISLNDIAAAPDGSLYLATDDGIYIWREGAVFRHLNRFEGIGTSEIVRTINVDAKNRVWFSSQGYVGYYADTAGTDTLIAIEMVTPATETTAIPQINSTPDMMQPGGQPKNHPASASFTPGSGQGIFSPVLDPLMAAINAIASSFGMRIFP